MSRYTTWCKLQHCMCRPALWTVPAPRKIRSPGSHTVRNQRLTTCGRVCNVSVRRRCRCPLQLCFNGRLDRSNTPNHSCMHFLQTKKITSSLLHLWVAQAKKQDSAVLSNIRCNQNSICEMAPFNVVVTTSLLARMCMSLHDQCHQT